MTNVDVRPASSAQVTLITKLTTERPGWKQHLSGHEFETVLDVLGGQKFRSVTEVRRAIDALLRSNPVVRSHESIRQVAGNWGELQRTLKTLPLSRYALPRVSDPETYDFFEVVERSNGVRYLNRLLGAPANWNREHLSVRLQTLAAGHIVADLKAAAYRYAVQHGRCAVCNAHLSDPTSIAASMGPVCRKRFA